MPWGSKSKREKQRQKLQQQQSEGYSPDESVQIRMRGERLKPEEKLTTQISAIAELLNTGTSSTQQQGDPLADLSGTEKTNSFLFESANSGTPRKVPDPANSPTYSQPNHPNRAAIRTGEKKVTFQTPDYSELQKLNSTSGQAGEVIYVDNAEVSERRESYEMPQYAEVHKSGPVIPAKQHPAKLQQSPRAQHDSALAQAALSMKLESQLQAKLQLQRIPTQSKTIATKEENSQYKPWLLRGQPRDVLKRKAQHLREAGELGDFFVRDGVQSKEGAYALSIKFGADSVKNFLVLRMPYSNGTATERFRIKGHEEMFASLESLIVFYASGLRPALGIQLQFPKESPNETRTTLTKAPEQTTNAIRGTTPSSTKSSPSKLDLLADKVTERIQRKQQQQTHATHQARQHSHQNVRSQHHPNP
eukprot:m.47637 g.47637  ORF g.47637 m.47637 type:complete len:419 (+) comp10520_c0_seq2:211-1467(+)